MSISEVISKGELSIGGMMLEYQLIGAAPSSPPVVVMLHEGLGSIDTWGEFPRRIFERTGAAVFVYSRAGYGASPSVERKFPLDYIKRHALDVLPGILDAIGFREGILLGHSDGASIAVAYTGNTLDPRVRGLVLMAPHMVVEPETLAEIRRARAAFLEGKLRQRLARYHADVDVAFWGWNDAWLDPAFTAFNLKEELTKIQVPMLIMRGDDDHYGTHRQVTIAQELCRCPVEALLMANCGHVPHREKLEQTLDVVAHFVERVLPKGLPQQSDRT
ncbi:MAG: alpha/beta hydrolase [Rhodoplanes sp.]